MNAPLFVLAIALALAAAPASAQQRPAAAPPDAAAATVGHWLYDDRGQIVGSVRSLSPDGRMAVAALGVYFYDHVRLVEIPAEALHVVDGKATLRGDAR